MKAAALAALALIIVAPALSRELIAEDIKITLDPAGNGDVVEEYRFSLDSADYPAFDRLVGSQALDEWKAFSPEIGPYVLGDKTSLILSAIRDFQRSPNYGMVTLSYRMQGLARKVSETGRTATYGLSAEQFAFYATEARTLYLPPKATLYVQLNKALSDSLKKNNVEAEPTPQTSYMDSDGRKVYVWRGPLTTTVFGLKYSLELGITESLGFERLWQGAYDFFMANPVYGIAVAVILVLAVIYRRQILGLIGEGFVGEETVEAIKK